MAAFKELFTNGETLTTAHQLSDLYELVDVEAGGTLVAVTLRPGPEGRLTAIHHAVLTGDVPLLHS